MRGHLILKAVVFCGTVTSGIGAFALPAAAGTGGDQGYGSVSNGTITATASAGTSGAADPSSGGTTGTTAHPPPCPYVPAPPDIAVELGTGGPGPGAWYLPSCAIPTFFSAPVPAIWVPAGQAPGAAPSVPALIQQALGEATLVDPTIDLNPPGEQVTNVSSWLWVAPGGWAAVVASATAGGVTATVTASPMAVVWNLGDGDTVTCPGPGVPYDRSKPAAEQSTYCTYTWRTSSAAQPGAVYVVTATIEYQVTTTVVGAPDPTPSLGTHPGPTSQATVAVSEVEALGTST